MLLKTYLISLPPDEFVTGTIPVGTETTPLTRM